MANTYMANKLANRSDNLVIQRLVAMHLHLIKSGHDTSRRVSSLPYLFHSTANVMFVAQRMRHHLPFIQRHVTRQNHTMTLNNIYLLSGAGYETMG